MSIRTFARSSILAGIALAAAGAANADVFLKVEGTPGDAIQKGFEGQITLSGANMSISNFVMPDPEGLVDTVRTTNVGPLFLNKSPDRSSAKLMMSAVEGAPLGTIEITFTTPSRPGQPQAVESRWILEGAEVRSFNVFQDPNIGLAPTETVEIAYSSMRYQYFAKDSKGQRTGSMEEVKWLVPDSQMFPFDEGCR
ncbi:MAG: type VI secretion system tube protein Hcp [Hyphomonadaceae bacterium]|nr:type VI secretion system tube protein Hcp [Hyphomonadaceae bacterium]